MRTSQYCPFCHITVAPADPRRMVRNGQAAHEGCVPGTTLQSALAEFRTFLAEIGAAYEASVFEVKLRTTSGVRRIAQLVEWTLQKLVAKGPAVCGPKAAAAIAARVADKLNVDIVVAAAQRPNGASTASRA